MDCSPPGFSVHGILWARILEWIAMPSSRGSSWLRDWTPVFCVSCIAGRFSMTEPLRKPRLELHPILVIRDSIPLYVVHPVTNWWALIVSLDILTSTPEAMHVSAGPLGLTFWKVGEFFKFWGNSLYSNSGLADWSLPEAWLPRKQMNERYFPFIRL